ncbi:hypothetical protein OF83DRAFT_1055919, partial [Amylostereum chailletii]
IHCDSRWCKWSPRHPTDCMSPACNQTCRQFRDFPQSYNPRIDNVCPACYQAGFR